MESVAPGVEVVPITMRGTCMAHSGRTQMTTVEPVHARRVKFSVTVKVVGCHVETLPLLTLELVVQSVMVVM